VVGCNRGPQVAPVRGRVVLDGQALKFGTVMFQHSQGGQPSVGEIAPDGSFVLSTSRPEDGAIVGTNKVRVTCYSSQSPENRDAGGDSLGTLLIPRKYTIFSSSGIEFDVPPEGLTDVTVELSSK
jgi:hypothetical protein